MPALVVYGDIYVDDVTVLEGPPIRDSVADNLIDRCAHALWVIEVIVWGRIGAMFNGYPMHYLINLVGGDARADSGMRCVQHDATDAARFSNPSKLFTRSNDNCIKGEKKYYYSSYEFKYPLLNMPIYLFRSRNVHLGI